MPSGPLTLEQLDNFGTLDSLPVSLDSSVWTSTKTAYDGSGFFDYGNVGTSIDNLVLLGDLDSLPYSLDSANYATTTLRENGGSISTNATVNAIGGLLITNDASVSTSVSRHC